MNIKAKKTEIIWICGKMIINAWSIFHLNAPSQFLVKSIWNPYVRWSKNSNKKNTWIYYGHFNVIGNPIYPFTWGKICLVNIPINPINTLISISILGELHMFDDEITMKSLHKMTPKIIPSWLDIPLYPLFTIWAW